MKVKRRRQFPKRPLTYAYSGEEKQPEEAQDGRSHHLVHSSGVDLLIQFGRQVGVVHIIPVHEVL